jgi:hypothetical protein
MTLSDVLLGHEMLSLVLSFVGCDSLITGSFGLGTTCRLFLLTVPFSVCTIYNLGSGDLETITAGKLISGNQTSCFSRTQVRQTCRSMSLVCNLVFVDVCMSVRSFLKWHCHQNFYFLKRKCS